MVNSIIERHNECDASKYAYVHVLMYNSNRIFNRIYVVDVYRIMRIVFEQLSDNDE
jgi:hypothetical protein